MLIMCAQGFFPALETISLKTNPTENKMQKKGSSCLTSKRYASYPKIKILAERFDFSHMHLYVHFVYIRD